MPMQQLRIAFKKKDVLQIMLLLENADKAFLSEALLSACANPGEFSDIIVMLIERGADINFKGPNDWTPLLVASGVNDRVDLAPQIKTLLDMGADVNTSNMFGETPLHFACQQGDTSCATLLIERGAHVDSVSHTMWTPLHDSCLNGQEDCVRILLEHSAHVDARNLQGRTPLHLASRIEHEGCIKLLIKHGADKEAKDDRGSKAFQEW